MQSKLRSRYAVDPVVDLQKEQMFNTAKSTMRTYNTESKQGSNASMSFVIDRPNDNMMLNLRNLKIRGKATLTLAASTPAAGSLFQPGYMGLRQHSIHDVIESYTISNGTISKTYPISQIIKAFEQYSKVNSGLHKYVPDITLAFDDVLNSQLYPFASYFDCPYDYESRSGTYSITTNTTSAASVIYNIEETLLPQSIFEDFLTYNLVGEAFKITINFKNVTALIQIDVDNHPYYASITSRSVDFSPHQWSITNEWAEVDPQDVPLLKGPIFYNLPDITVHTFGVTGITTGSTFTLNSGNIKLDRVPRAIFAYIDITDSKINYIDHPDVCLPIDNISVNFAESNNNFSQMSTSEYFEIAKANGFNKSYQYFVGLVSQNLSIGAGVFLFSPSHNISTAGLIEGSASGGNMAIKVTSRNTYGSTLPFTLNVIVVNDDILGIENNGATSHMFSFANTDLVERYHAQFQVGGGFWDTFKKGIVGIHDFVKQNKLLSKGAETLSNIGVPYVGTAANIIKSLGYGEVKGSGNMERSGGKNLTLSDLKKLMK